VALLGGVAVLSTLAAAVTDPGGAITDASLVLFVASGWALLRFRDSLMPLRRRLRFFTDVLVVLTVLFLLAAYVPLAGAQRQGPVQIAAALWLLVIWGGCVGEPLLTFWRKSRRLPTVQRSRLRSLVLAYAGIVVVLILSVVFSVLNGGNSGYRLTFLVALLVVPCFYVAFAPPSWLRRIWRDREEEPLREALNGLLLYSPDRQTLADRAVGWAARLVGADGAIIATDDGSVLATYGLDRAEAWDLIRTLSADADGSRPSPRLANVIETPLRSDFGTGMVAVRAGPLTPLFSHDEVSRLQSYSTALTTALDRVTLVERLRRSAELIDLAYNPIFTWSVRTGLITYWNRAAEQTYGHSAEEAVGRRPDALLETRRPLPADEILAKLQIEEQWNGEVTRKTKSGQVLDVSVRLALQRDAQGEPETVMETNRDITLEKRMTGELRQARDEAEKASAAKSEYLSRMSHELRTPLTAILGYSDLLELREPRDDQLEAIASIQEASSHLLSLVNDVLDIARIESGREVLNNEPVSVASTVEECVRLVAPAAAQRNVLIETDLGACRLEYVSADRHRLVQAVLNLLSNAVKYSGEQARVVVSARPASGDRVALSVSDSGPGLTPEQRARLFQPFDRLGAERTTTPGTGLGLALTKKLIEAMGGSISVRSEPSKGATFTVKLGRVVPALADPGVPVARLAPPPAEDDARELTVLYVEDTLATISLMEEVFAMRPRIRLIKAMQGRLAIELAREHHPDLMVLDLHLPDIDGAEVLRTLRRDPETAAMPVVMFSADATERQVRRLLSEGACRYLLKPAKVADFLAVLDEVLATASDPAQPVAS
jgi:PAS domain S-box-containing protein